MTAITINVSDELATLARGFAVIQGQTVESYLTDALMDSVQADCEARHCDSAPEFQARKEALA